MAAMAMIGPFHMSYRNYQYSREEAALYNALSPILWSSFIGWSVFAVTSGYAGKPNRPISWSSAYLEDISLLSWRNYHVKSLNMSKFKYYSDLRLFSVACNLIRRLRGNIGYTRSTDSHFVLSLRTLTLPRRGPACIRTPSDRCLAQEEIKGTSQNGNSDAAKCYHSHVCLLFHRKL